MASAAECCVTSEMLNVSQQLANTAASITLPLFRTPVDVTLKSDETPVTEADRSAEAAMRECIMKAFPEHGIFGEEGGYVPGTGEGADWLWIFDPIDGTKAFVTGKPLWGTLIALLHKGNPVLGIIDMPALKERWIGVEGKQTVMNGQPAQTRACSDISNAYLYATTPRMFTGATENAFNKLSNVVREPLYGTDCYAYALVASGYCDLVAEADLKPYDYMALVPIIKGAGGKITDWNDGELYWNPDAESANGDSITAWAGERKYDKTSEKASMTFSDCLKVLCLVMLADVHVTKILDTVLAWQQQIEDIGTAFQGDSSRHVARHEHRNAVPDRAPPFARAATTLTMSATYNAAHASGGVTQMDYREADKRRKYTAMDPSGYAFQPLVHESYGRLGKCAAGLLNVLADHAVAAGGVSKSQFVSWALRELSVGLCQGNGALYRRGARAFARVSGAAFEPGLSTPQADDT